MNTLITQSSLSVEEATIITNEIIEQRKNTIIYGRVGTGKTVLMEAIVREAIKANQRIVYLPVASEIDFGNNVLTIEVKNQNKSELIVDTSRHLPDLTVIEEIRTPEELKSVMNLWRIGHQVIFTIHAGSLNEMIARCMDLLADDEFYIEAFQKENFFGVQTIKTPRQPYEVLINKAN